MANSSSSVSGIGVKALRVLATPVVRNVAFSAVGKAALALVSIAGSILYFRSLGASRYAAIGWYLLGYSILSIIEPPFSAAIIRQLSRTGNSLLSHGQIRAIRRLEMKYLSTVLAAAVALSAVAWIALARHAVPLDLGSEGRPVGIVGTMLIALAAQWCLAFYNGCFLGLQRHGALQIFTVAFSSIRLFASLAVLWLCKQQLLAFFICQMVVSVVQLAASRQWIFGELKKAASHENDEEEAESRPKKTSDDLMHVSIVSIILLIYNQWDKLLVGATFSSHVFGVYSLVWQIIGGLYAAYSPICNVFFPLVTAGIRSGDHARAKERYQQAAQVMAVAVVPPTLIITLYAKDILWLMTSDHSVANTYWGVLAALMPSAMFSAFLFVPWAAQLAAAKTGRSIKRFIVTLVLLMASQAAAAYAGSLLLVAAAYTVVTLGQTFWIANITHREIVLGADHEWGRYAIVKPLLVGGVTAAALRVVSTFMHFDTVVATTIQLACMLSITMLVVALQVPATRALVRQWRSVLVLHRGCVSS